MTVINIEDEIRKARAHALSHLPIPSPGMVWAEYQDQEVQAHSTGLVEVKLHVRLIPIPPTIYVRVLAQLERDGLARPVPSVLGDLVGEA